jgi:rhamnulokinase
VIAGPAEATAIGNILVQAIGAGEITDLVEARALVARSFELETFVPHSRPLTTVS